MKNENEIKRAFAREVIDEIDKIRIGNSCCNNIIWSIKDRVQSLLPKEEEVDWSKASYSERLEFAQIKYAKGIEFIPVCENNNKFKSTGRLEVSTEGDIVDKGSIYYPILNESGSNKWAEIVEPEAKTVLTSKDIDNFNEVMTNIWDAQEASEFKLHPTTPEMQEEFKKANPEMRLSESEEPLYMKKLKEALDEMFPKTESDEVKAVVEVEYAGRTFNLIHQWGDRCWIHQEGNDFGRFVYDYQLSKQPTLEQKARKKAEEILNQVRNAHGYLCKDKALVHYDEASVRMLLEDAYQFDPKTL